jgi:hypothetical protein
VKKPKSKSRLHSPGDLVAIPLPELGGYGVVLLADYFQRTTISGERALWYGFNLHATRMEDIDLKLLNYENVAFIMVAISPRASPCKVPKPFARMPEFSADRWPMPPGNGRAFGDGVWSDARFVDLCLRLGLSNARIKGTFGLTKHEYQQLPSVYPGLAFNQALHMLLERFIRNPEATYRVHMTAQSVDLWHRVNQKAIDEGVLDPNELPEPDPPPKRPKTDADWAKIDLWSMVATASERSRIQVQFCSKFNVMVDDIPRTHKPRIRKQVVDALKQANTWDLWAAAYIMNGGCSDDGFLYFRCWLIAQGKEVFEKVRDNAELLGELKLRFPEEDGAFEMESLISDLFEELPGGVTGKAPSGRRWDIEDESEQRKRLPKICKMFLK